MISGRCISIVSFPPHFEYCINLLEQLQLRAADVADFDVYVFVDGMGDGHMLQELVKTSGLQISVRVLSVEEIFSDVDSGLLGAPSISALRSLESSHPSWGPRGHRDWVARKRTLALLYLKSLGYQASWTLDSESEILGSIRVGEIFELNSDTLRLPLTYEPNSGHLIRLPKHMQGAFRENLSSEQFMKVVNAGLRQNDFWVIDLGMFFDAIRFFNRFFGQGIGSWLKGTEFLPYEAFLLSSALTGGAKVELTVFSELFESAGITLGSTDLHSNRLLVNAIKSKEVDIREVGRILNEGYFKYAPGFRGDYLRQLGLFGPRGRELRENLAVQVAVSNSQNKSLRDVATAIRTRLFR